MKINNDAAERLGNLDVERAESMRNYYSATSKTIVGTGPLDQEDLVECSRLSRSRRSLVHHIYHHDTYDITTVMILSTTYPSYHHFSLSSLLLHFIIYPHQSVS